MPSHPAIGVYDDLSSSQIRVAHRAADHETSRGVDEELCLLVQKPASLEHRPDYFFYLLCRVFPVFDIRIVLVQHHRIDANRLITIVLEGDLAFCVRPEPRYLLGFAQLCRAMQNLVCIHN